VLTTSTGTSPRRIAIAGTRIAEKSVGAAAAHPDSPRNTTTACRAQAKKRYSTGHPLPAGFAVLPVPALLLPRLAPSPPATTTG